MGNALIKAGAQLRFTYNVIKETSDDPSDRFKECIILHPNWQGKVHALDLKRMTVAERRVLAQLFDPKTYEKGFRSRFPLVEDVRRRMNVIEEVKNPVSFYAKFVKVFLRGKDAYRTYYPANMINITVVKESHVEGQVSNPNPLFRKV